MRRFTALLLAAALPLTCTGEADAGPKKLRSSPGTLVAGTNLTITTSSDHIEAGEWEKPTVQVQLKDDSGNPRAGVTVVLTATAGTLNHTSFLTDEDGVGTVDLNQNGTIDENEPKNALLTSPRHGTFATLRAEGGNEVGHKEVLFHEVKLENFSQPKLLGYYPESENPAIADPEITFTIGDAPAVATDFNVTISIHHLDNESPWVSRTFANLPPGTYTKKMSDFVYLSGEEPNGRVPSPGDGLFPFQIEVQVAHMNGAKLPNLNEVSCAHSNWKASKSLIIKPSDQLPGGYTVSYDEATEQNILTYICDVTNTNSTTAPTVARVDVYDPDFMLTDSVAQFSPPVQSPEDPHTFVYTFRGPVTIDKAGDYHFVVEIQENNDISEGKDRQKWALERNTGFDSPPYISIGFDYKGDTNEAGVPIGFHTVSSATNIDASLKAAGFASQSTVLKPYWWEPARFGLKTNINVNDAIGDNSINFNPPQKPQVANQTIQYNAVWSFVGHGSLKGKWHTGQLVWFQDDDVHETGSISSVLLSTKDQTRIPGTPNHTHFYLDNLPPAYAKKPTGFVTYPTAPLVFSRLVSFMGCWTAASSPPHTKATDLPREAVRLGAESAVGVEGEIYQSNLNNAATQLFRSLRDEKFLSVACAEAEIAGSFGVGPDQEKQKIKFHGNGRMQFVNPRWRPNYRP